MDGNGKISSGKSDTNFMAFDESVSEVIFIQRFFSTRLLRNENHQVHQSHQ